MADLVINQNKYIRRNPGCTELGGSAASRFQGSQGFTRTVFGSLSCLVLWLQCFQPRFSSGPLWPPSTCSSVVLRRNCPLNSHRVTRQHPQLNYGTASAARSSLCLWWLCQAASAFARETLACFKATKGLLVLEGWQTRVAFQARTEFVM